MPAGIQSGTLPGQEGAEKQLKRQPSSNESETSSEGEEVEAEEERLPVMIAPGHILFESEDEGTSAQFTHNLFRFIALVGYYRSYKV